MQLKKWLQPDIWIGVLILLVLTIPFAVTDLDLTLAKFFYHTGWGQGDLQPWYALYHYGTLPGLILSGLSLFALIGSWLWPKLLRWRRPGAVIILTLLLGPGLFVNVLGKGYCGRHRPRDITVFQGQETFQRIIQLGTPGQGKAFPCGHASVGYLFMALYFVDQARRRKKWWLGIGFTYGTLMGIGRMAQGAHFASDVLWAGGLTYLSAAVVQHIILPLKIPSSSAPTPPSETKKQFLAWLLLGISLTALTVFFLLATPYYKEWKYSLPNTPSLQSLKLNVAPDQEEVQILPADQPEAIKIQSSVHGFGFPKLKYQGTLATEMQGNTLVASLQLFLSRWVTEKQGKIILKINKNLPLGLNIQGKSGHVFLGDNQVPGFYTSLRIDIEQGNIDCELPPASQLRGSIHLQTLDGNIRIRMSEITHGLPIDCKLVTRKGNLTLAIRQTQKTSFPFQIKGRAIQGDISFQGKFHHCGMRLSGQSNPKFKLVTQGEWSQKNQEISGPGIEPLWLNVDLSAAGPLLIDLEQLKKPSIF